MKVVRRQWLAIMSFLLSAAVKNVFRDISYERESSTPVYVYTSVRTEIHLSACTPIEGCTSGITCTTDTDSLCQSCLPGYFLPQDGTCQSKDPSVLSLIWLACTPVTNCASTVTCQSAFDSHCTKCITGYFIRQVTGFSDQCLGEHTPASFLWLYLACSCPHGFYMSQQCTGLGTQNSPTCTSEYLLLIT